MASTPAPGPRSVLDFWFGELDADGFAAAETAARWFRKDPAFDQELRDRFLDEHRAIVAGQREAWLDSPEGRLAYILVLDQFSRNMFRDTPAMFATDELARATAVAGIDRGDDRAVTGHQRAFYYLPLMHSESLADQERCVALFTEFRDQLQGAAREIIEHNLRFAHAHRDIIARWGRFPHRNAILGRPSTAAELAFLEQPGSSF